MKSAAEQKAAGNAACRRYHERTREKRNPARAVYMKAHYAANREAIQERRRIYLEANRDEVNEKRRLYRAANQDKVKAQRAAREAADPGWQARKAAEYRVRHAERVRDRYLARYGITQQDYERIAAEQGHVCKICGGGQRQERTALLYVDHNHDTGKVRGLLCMHCNAALGAFQDNKALLEKAISYLESCRDA